jgi:outer membrane protein
VTLDEAIRRALDVQPAMVQARGDASNARAQQRAAFGGFLPTVEVRSGTFRQNVPSIVNGLLAEAGTYQYSSNISARLELFDGFRRLAQIRSARAAGDAAGAGKLNEQFQVTLQTKQLYYDALAREELVVVAEAQVRRAGQQLRISVQKLQAGSATRSDSLRSVVDLGNARLALLQSIANLATAQANLGRQIGVDALVRAIPDTALPTPPDTAALRGTLLETAPQVVQAEAEARAAKAGVWSARSLYWPSLIVSYNSSSQGLTQPWQGFHDANRNVNRLEFTLSWTLFNGFTREQQQVTASVARNVAEALAADTRRQVNASLTQQIAALGTSYAQIEIAAANVAAATEDVRVQQERYRVGAGTILDLLTSQTSLTQAQTDLVQARFNYLIARAQLEALVGRSL